MINNALCTLVCALCIVLSTAGSVFCDIKSELSQNELSLESFKSTSRLILNAEPGDGLINISWQLVSAHKTAAISDMRYTIKYGTESGKLRNIISVGATTSYTLKGLKNNQLYFISVTMSQIQSDEIAVTPVAVDGMRGSSLEKSFSRRNLTLLDKYESEPFKRELRQFGYDFFKNSSSLLSKMDNIPVGGDYILGPGDTLSITVWGAIDARHDLTIDRNGEIVIPKVGAVKVWGLTYDQAKEVINRAIGQYFKNFELNVTLGRLRTIQIYIVGEVELPGSYPISALATVINALSAAGGPTRNGTLRSIKLTRNGKQIADIDLYQMFLSGDRSSDQRLQNGDTIFVPVIGSVVAVAGEIKRPAIYELKGKTSLPEVLKMTGGVTASGFTGRIQVERFSENSSRIILDYRPSEGNIENIGSVNIQDRDMIKVFSIQDAVRQVVSLRGNVIRPGEYQFRLGMRVRDLIPSFDVLLPESYLESAEITRLVLPDYHREVFTFNLRKALNNGDADNVPLHEQDAIRVFSRTEMLEKPSVAINGHVVSPGSYDHFPGMTVRDLITASGSPKRSALLKQAELSRVIVENEKASLSRKTINLEKALNSDPEQNIILQPDDVLIVRGITDWLDSADKYVNIKGEVKYPGIYSITRGERLSSLILRAGGYTNKAYLKGAKFTRRSVRETQQQRMDEIIAKTEQNILQKQLALASTAASREEIDSTKAMLEALLKQLDSLKKAKAEGRVTLVLAQTDILRKSSFDLELEGGDQLDIPARPDVVNVMGQVYNATSFVYMPEKTSVETYLNLAGGANREADESDIYIIRADGSVQSKQQSSFGIKWNEEQSRWTFGGFYATPMYPGDTLVVPQKIDRIAWIREIKDITAILSQLAITAGTVFLGLR